MQAGHGCSATTVMTIWVSSRCDKVGEVVLVVWQAQGTALGAMLVHPQGKCFVVIDQSRVVPMLGTQGLDQPDMVHRDCLSVEKAPARAYA